MKYYTSVLGLDKIIEVKPVFYRKEDRSVFCTSPHTDDAELLIRLVPEVIATHEDGFLKRGRRKGFSKQRLILHFAANLPAPPENSIQRIAEVPTAQQLKKLLEFGT